MPRRRRESKRRHELTLDVLNLLLWMRREDWEEFWGGPAEGRPAFSSLRHAPALETRATESYEAWISRRAAENRVLELGPDPRRAARPAPAEAPEDRDDGDGGEDPRLNANPHLPARPKEP